MSDLPKRKANRLNDYDYSSPGYYFLTLCTENRDCILSRITEASPTQASQVVLSERGKVVEQAICSIPTHYPAVHLDKYVIMPNHIHIILALEDGEKARPSISRIMQQMKGVVTKRLHEQIWQDRFHDHIIRGDADYREIWEYIDNNPTKWSLDRYYH